MAKQELDEKLEFEKAVGVSPKSGLREKIVSLFKFILSLLLLPLVLGFTISFSRELLNQQRPIVNNFVFAIVTYLILHIFILEPRGFYTAGQKMVNVIFIFLPFLKNLLSLFLPIYSLLIFGLYFIGKMYFSYDNIIGYSIFLISFTAVMHLVLTAVHLKDEPQGILKGDYFFSLSLVYLFEILLIAVFLKFMLNNFSFMNIVKSGYKFFVDTHIAIFRQLFVVGR